MGDLLASARHHGAARLPEAEAASSLSLPERYVSLQNIPVILSLTILCAALLVLMLWALRQNIRAEIEHQIDLHAKCPACGHRGCELHFIPPPNIVVVEAKGIVRTLIEQARVERKCRTCGALS